MFEFANGMRPLFAAALTEHEALMKDAGAEKYLRKNGWLKVYRNPASLKRSAVRPRGGREGGPRIQAGRPGRRARARTRPRAGFRQRRVLADGGEHLQSARGHARLRRAFLRAWRRRAQRRCASLHRANETLARRHRRGAGGCAQAVVALGPWSQKVLDPLGLKLPLQVKRGYHLHFKPRGKKGSTARRSMPMSAT